MTQLKGGNGKKSEGLVSKIARITGYSEDYVRKVRSGKRTNECIMSAIMEYREGESKLLQEVARLVPISHTITRKGVPMRMKRD